MLEEKSLDLERELTDALAGHVEDPVLLAAVVQLGSLRLGRSRANPLAGGWLLPTIFGEERGLPRDAIIAGTPTDIYIFDGERVAIGEWRVEGPLRRWPRATLRAVQVKRFGRAASRLLLTLESGKKAIITFSPLTSSKAARERVREVFLASPGLPATDSSEWPPKPSIPGHATHAHPYFEPGESLRFRLAELPPLLFMVPPMMLFLWPAFRLLRGSRALLVTDRNLYVVRGHGPGASVLYKAPIGSVRVEPRGNEMRGRYLEVADQRIWLLARPAGIEEELAAANGR